MPTTVDALSCVPCQFESGTTVRFTEGDAEFPATLWTAVFVLNNGVAAATSIAGVANGVNFDYVIPASPALTPGLYQWAFYYTAISPTTEKARGYTGSTIILPNLGTTATPSNAQAMVTLLETALRALAASTQVTVSFNGQSFSRENISNYQEQLVFWKAQVIAEQRAAARLRGEISDGRIAIVFVGPTSNWPWTGRCP